MLTEDDWNDESIEWVEREGDGTPKFVMYVASKTLAEKAAWKFMKDHEAEVSFDLVVLTPPYVFGPVLHDVSRPTDLNTSMANWYEIVIGGTKTDDELISTK